MRRRPPKSVAAYVGSGTSADVRGHSNSDLKKVVTDGQGKMKPIKSVAGTSPTFVA